MPPPAAAAPVEVDGGAIRRGIAHTVASLKPGGFVVYGFDFLSDTEQEKDSLSAANATRQAFVASALAEHLESRDDAAVRDAVARMLDALGRRSLPIGKDAVESALERARLLSIPFGRYKLRDALDRAGLLYRPSGSGRVVSASAGYADAHLGATALALLAEVRLFRATGDARFADLRRGWLQALADMRVPGAGFRWVPTSIDGADFYDGEAWLALAEYVRAFPQDELARSTLASVDADLLARHAREFRVAFFHWGTMSAAARYRDSRQARFLDFVRAQMTAFLAARGASPDDENRCYWLEGAADGLSALESAGEGDAPLARSARDWLARETAKSLALQIRPGQTGIDFPGGRLDAPRMREFAGAFLEGVYSPRIRADLTMHCVSAMNRIRRGRLLSPPA